MSVTIGLLAHVDAGKTTLAEQILYKTGALRTPGRVDSGTAFLDCGEMERRRGITIFSDQAYFTLEGRGFHLLDTPGHVDFSGEMERSLRVLDYAIVVVSCVEGIQAHTRTVWRLLQEQGIPVLVFLNKADRTGADPEGVLAWMGRELGPCIAFDRFQSGKMDEGLIEKLAELDDALLERYLDGGYDPAVWKEAAVRLFGERRVFPAFSGSAQRGDGVEALLEALCLLTRERGSPDAELRALCYKVRHDKTGRVAFLKIENGTLHPKEGLPSHDGLEKVNELRRYQGAKYVPLTEALPGDLCAVTGVALHPGDGIGMEARQAFALRPLLSAGVEYDFAIPAATMLSYLRELEEEEPLLGVTWNERAGQIQVRVMGQVQLEVLHELVQERFGVDIGFGPCEILYLETIAAPVIGCGHFEPLRHYAEVHVRLSPGPRGSGVSFDSACPTDDLAVNWQRLIRSQVLGIPHCGILTGAPLTDVKITLLAGRAHLKHTEGGDFGEAVKRAIRQALMCAENKLLEPYYAFVIEVEYSLCGRVLSDIRRMSGEYDPPEAAGDSALIRGRVPVATSMEYPAELNAFTHGEGRISLCFDGYEPCHNQDEAVDKAGYDPESDPQNPAGSVFCSHGAGYAVPWHEAPGKMHIQIKGT